MEVNLERFSGVDLDVLFLTAEMRASAERWRRSHTSFVEELPGKPVRGPNALSLRLWAAAKASRLSL